MYLYKEQEGKKDKWIASAATLAYVLLWVVLILTVSFTFPEQQEPDQGIMINFGDTDSASGDMDPNVAENAGAPSQPDASSGEQDILTQEHEPAPVVAPAVRPAQNNTQQRPSQNTTATTPAQPTQQVNPAALFPGATQGSTSASEGTGTGAGNQGNLAGSPTGSHAGTGTGDSGVSFNLSGRQPVGTLQRPVYTENQRGTYKVIVRIIVNPDGKVTSASYQPTGSTTNDSAFVNAALSAARKSQFSVSEAANDQTGTITYVFNIR